MKRDKSKKLQLIAKAVTEPGIGKNLQRYLVLKNSCSCSYLIDSTHICIQFQNLNNPGLNIAVAQGIIYNYH